jgi:hypothetical protein
MRAIETDPQKRYGHYTQMLYELTHPEKVEPYFQKSASLVERNPLTACRIVLGIAIALNILQLIF